MHDDLSLLQSSGDTRISSILLPVYCEKYICVFSNVPGYGPTTLYRLQGEPIHIDGNHTADKLICSDGLNFRPSKKPYIEIRGPAGMSRQTRLATKMIWLNTSVMIPKHEQRVYLYVIPENSSNNNLLNEHTRWGLVPPKYCWCDPAAPERASSNSI